MDTMFQIEKELDELENELTLLRSQIDVRLIELRQKDPVCVELLNKFNTKSGAVRWIKERFNKELEKIELEKLTPKQRKKLEKAKKDAGK